MPTSAHPGDKALVSAEGRLTALGNVLNFNSNCLSGGSLTISIEPMLKQPVLQMFDNPPGARSLAGLATKRGVPSAQLKRIHSAAGTETGAVTAADISLSVPAELMRQRRAQKPGARPEGCCCYG